MKIGILGGGVAGSLLYMLLRGVGQQVDLYDLKDKYFKPCGDIVPNVYTPPFPWKVDVEVKNFAFYLDGELMYDVDYRYPKWLVIDKWGWINSMRSITKLSRTYDGNYDVTIDARGPYPMDREVVYTTRAIVKTGSQLDRAIFEFDSKLTGFYWVFPAAEGTINVGAGFLEERNSRRALLDYMKTKLGEYELKDLRGAPISVGEVGNRKLKVGEARGLVFPMSGEGIRPSAISAEVAFEALTKEKEFDQFLEERLGWLDNRIRIQRILLSIYRGSPPHLRRTMLRALIKSDVLIDAYLDDKLDLNGILDAVRLTRSGAFTGKLKK
ncbi:NAD(P)/FAD-dependent oxidoreductase [Sulfodiicoccus acidiphilus]|uniref:NAD(P)/FAD-dependent oxidoreductase n=1 Tax=Sulfodiicoccus acidiphilus TaxID=1670455 RepID=UPI000F83CC04|nr:NAD(P)/FAD-dependent oxidoreductase [Sulfodiicoccus acidiphilus]